MPVAAPVSLRLIGMLDGELVAAFEALERGLEDLDGSTVIVDVRDLELAGERAMVQLTAAIAEARRRGRDVRLDARGLTWRRIAKKHLSTQPPVDAKLRSGTRRTVIMAHSERRPRR
jgi:hypothetical protein